MENDDVPDWAIEEAIKRADFNMELCVDEIRSYSRSRANAVSRATMLAARLIAQHEKPPVDPDLMLAREIAALVADEWNLAEGTAVEKYRAGRYDNDDDMIAALKLLKERKG